MAHEIVKCGGCQAVIIQCRCPGPHATRYSTCGNCQAEIDGQQRRRKETPAAMERLREDETQEAGAASAQAQAKPDLVTVTRPGWTVIGFPLNSVVAHELSAALERYQDACLGVRHALENAGTSIDRGISYANAKTIKAEVYDQCKEVFERVLAHIGVRAP